jgi:hypothetical protein
MKGLCTVPKLPTVSACVAEFEPDEGTRVSDCGARLAEIRENTHERTYQVITTIANSRAVHT